MNIRLFAIGKVKKNPERALWDKYLDRARQTGAALGIRHILLHEYREAAARDVGSRKTDEGQRLMRAAAGDFLIALDENGELWDTETFSRFIRARLDEGTDVSFLIGGADGLSDAVISGADKVIALGRMTWPHQIARLLLCEQLYRVTTVLSGHPYHRS